LKNQPTTIVTVPPDAYSEIKQAIDSLSSLSGRVKRELPSNLWVMFESYVKQAQTALGECVVEIVEPKEDWERALQGTDLDTAQVHERR